MAYDLLIKDAQICDGTGAPIYSGSLAVEDGKIAALGEISGIARRELNARGSVLAPGFIDIHTHYDAQVSWDPLLTCSSWHGITSLLMGNCGVGWHRFVRTNVRRWRGTWSTSKPCPMKS